MGAIFYRVTHGQPARPQPPVIVQIEGAKIGATAATAQGAHVVWTHDDKTDEWGDLAGVQFELELQDPPAPIEQLRLFADYR
jgi:hypothetical protein